MSPARMYSFAASMHPMYSADVIVRAASAHSIPGGGAASSSPDSGERPPPAPAQSAASSRSRAHAASYASATASASTTPAGASGTTTLSTSTIRWRQWSNAQNCPITTSAASGWPRSSAGGSGSRSTSRTTS